MTRFTLASTLAASFLSFAAMGQSAETLTARRDSPLIQNLVRQPLPAGHRETHRAVQVLANSGNIAESDLLDRFEKRRVLARLTGESIDLPATIAAAMEREAAPPEKLDDAVWRALDRVVIEYSPAEARASQPLPPGFEPAGPGLWVKIAPPYGELRALLLIRNGLSMPATGVTLYYGQTRKNMGFHLIRLTCTPDGGAAFDPGKPQQALCTGSGERGVVEDAVKALAARKVAAPLLASIVKTAEASLLAGSIATEYPATEAAAEARTELANASCAAKGTCGNTAVTRSADGAELLSVKTRSQLDAERPSELFGGLALAAFLLAGVVAARARPAEVKGWVISLVAGVAIFTSAVAAIAAFLMLRPSVGYEGFLYLIVVYYGAIPHFIAVLIVCVSLGHGGVTRLRVFAATVGILVPVLIGATVSMMV